MKIKIRMLLCAIQLCVLCLITFLVTGKIYSAETWYAAGILAVIINPQLLEPYYPKPVDVIGNAVFSLILVLTTPKKIAIPGWYALGVLLILIFISGIIATIWGAGREKNEIKPISKVASIISREATSIRIYSIVFFLSLLESYPSFGYPFWVLVIGWLIIVIIGIIPWDKIVGIIKEPVKMCVAHGMVGPNFLQIYGSDIPPVGSSVNVILDEVIIEGLVTSRIKRQNDTWGEIHISNQVDCELILKSQQFNVKLLSKESEFIGAVFTGSTIDSLVFYPVINLSIGEVVAISNNDKEVYFQVVSAKLDDWGISGGAHLRVISTANQIGYFDTESLCLRKFGWVPSPGSSILGPSSIRIYSDIEIPENKFKIGTVIGSDIPVFLDLEDMCSGHLAILGMTKMGKTSLAYKIATELSKEYSVTILDQTGEFRAKRKLGIFREEVNFDNPGISVAEPSENNSPKFALDFLNSLINRAKREYEAGTEKKRIIIIDEAHQFIPEPAGMGFKTPGRDESMKFGLLMMQVRKYGISIIFISQRTAVVAKSALSQCENILAFKSVDKTGLDYLDTIAGHQYRDILPNLMQGQALVFGPAVSSDFPVAITVDYIKEVDLHHTSTTNGK